MKYVICSIYDTATEAYMRPFFAQTAAQAVRMFQDEVKNPDSPMNAHPEHYALFEIGAFTDHDAKLHTDMTITCLAKAHEIKESK